MNTRREVAGSLNGVVGENKTANSAALLEVLSIFFRDSRRIGAVFLLCLLLTLIVSFIPQKKYTSDAALLLRLGREYVYTPEVGEPVSGSPIAYDREQTLLAETKILTSREIKMAVLDKMGAAQIYPKLAGKSADEQRSAALINFEGALDAELLKGSNLMQISFTHSDPIIAAKVLTEVIDAYLQRRSVIFASSASGTAEADLVLRTIQLNVAEAKLAALKSERHIRAFGEEQSLLLAQRNVLEMRQADADLALAQAGGRASSLSRSLNALSGDVTLFSETQRSEAIENARKLLLDLTLKERDLSSKYVDSNMSVQDVRADIKRTTDFIAELEAHPTRTIRSGRSPARDVAESELLRTVADTQHAKSGTSTLAAQRAAIDKRLAVFAAAEVELPALERERKFAEVNYEAAAKRLRDEQALEDLDRQRRSNVSIVQAPMAPSQGKSMQLIILIVGTFLSFCAALLTAFLSALLRDTFLTPSQVERRLGLPILAAVPGRME
jgi:polysaccharide biosynthesis protein PslE